MTKVNSNDFNKDILSAAIKFEEDGRKLYLECIKKLSIRGEKVFFNHSQMMN